MYTNIKLEDFQISLQKQSLSNGINIIHFKKSNAPIAIKICSKSGSRYDLDGKSGLGHFVEHMVLQGTEKYPTKRDISMILEDYGGGYSASTTRERIAFDFIVARKAEIKLVRDIAYQFINKPLFDEKTIENEKRVIKTEISSKLDFSKTLVNNGIFKLLYGDSNLSKNVGGSEESITNIQKEDLRYHLENILPTNMTIVSCGDCELKDIAEDFEGCLPYKTEIREPNLPVLTAPLKYGFTKMEENKLIYCKIAFPTCNLESPDSLALGIIASYLGKGRLSLLRDILRQQNGLLYSISSTSNHYSDTGFLGIEMSLKSENLGAALEKIKQSIISLRDKGMDVRELNRIKNKVINSNIIAYQTVQSWVDFHYYRELIVKNNNFYYDDYLNSIVNITKEEVDEVVRKYLNLGNMYFYAVGNLDENFYQYL